MPYGTLNADTITNSNGLSGNAIGPGFKNRIINGDMRIDQRNAGAAVTTSPAFPVDRFSVGNGTDGAYSGQRDTSAPVGFVNSVKITTTTADATLTTTQALQFSQNIEGTNVPDLAWGTANAKTVTLSFWVRSSLTGTFGGALRNGAFDRSYPFTYSISVADTWEQKSVTIAGDTSGTWLTTTGIGINVAFGLGVGPDRSGTAGAWAGANYIAPTGATSVIGTLNATWYITGVQLEVAPSATSFDYRPYGTELALCQRYAIKYGATGGLTSATPTVAFRSGAGNAIENAFPLPTSMRAAPTITNSSPTWVTSSPTGNQIAFFNLTASVYATISGALTISLDGNVTSTNEYASIRLAAGTSFSGSSGDHGWIFLGSTGWILYSSEL